MNFVIEILHEILILFENAIEIYGNIRGADNSFQIQAYEQGKKTDLDRVHINVWTLAWLDL